MIRRALLKLALANTLLPATVLAATPTPAQRCEADIELASAKLAQCRLITEARFSKGSDAAKRATALAKCSEQFRELFAKATSRYGLNCTEVPEAAFDAYLAQCSNDVATASALGGGLPDCGGDLAACSADLTSTQTKLTTCERDLSICQATPPAEQAKLLTTGQTASYGTGDDGNLQKGVGREYTDNGDGTISDIKTGLMWEKKSDDGGIHDKDNTYTWASGAGFSADGTIFTEFLSALNAAGGFAGHTDWRLPNLTELESIRDLGAVSLAVPAAFNDNCGLSSSGNAGCPVTTCSCTGLYGYWSSSTYAHYAWDAWLVVFSDGYGVPNIKSGEFYARAVRGGY